jgi:EmrB/QacA subfamily drug resistance transporter
LTRAAGPKRLGRLTAMLGIATTLGPMGGPILSGWLIGSFGWQWIFLINIPIGALAFTLAAVVFTKDEGHPSETFDFIGMLLLSPGLALFLYGVSSLPAHGTLTHRAVWIPASVGLIMIFGFVLHALVRADHPLLDLRLFKYRTVALANTTMVLMAIAAVGAVLLFPSYLQQLLHQTPLQSGAHLIPRGLGAILAMPIAGRILDKCGPGWVVLAASTLIAIGLATFTYGVSHHSAYAPVLLIGLTLIGMGQGATFVPLFGSAVRGLAPHQVARASTLVHVNLQVGGSIGVALMSVILTSQFNRSPFIQAAGKVVALKQEATKHGLPPHPLPPPPQVLAPGFMDHMTSDLSHAYTVAFVVAVGFALMTLIPAVFLPKEPAADAPDQAAIPALAP